MNAGLPDIPGFDRKIFHKRDPLGFLLTFSRELVQAGQAGLLYGTDGSGARFLPPAQWDRGVMDRFSGRGVQGMVLKWLGRYWMRMTRQSPVRLFRIDHMGVRIETDGVIAYTLRHHQAFYSRGIRILLIDDLFRENQAPDFSRFQPVQVAAYDGHKFSSQRDIRADTAILNRFKTKNFVAAYIPDYGAMVFNNLEGEKITQKDGAFIYGDPLKSRLDILIGSIEKASLAHLGRARGRSAARMVWRKEKGLRKTIVRLQEKEAQLREQETQLWAVGAVTPAQLTMAPVLIHDGVYGFMDMAGSVKVRQQLAPKDYFYLLNCCHEIAAENAGRFGCRVDNIIGDAVFFQNISVFDPQTGRSPDPVERLMRMTLLLASVLSGIDRLTRGDHWVDRPRKVHTLVKARRIRIRFRAGMNQGRAQVGPLGSTKRKIVTAVGEAVDLASRLESSGRADYIHTLAPLVSALEEAWVSKKTRQSFYPAKDPGPGRQRVQPFREGAFFALYKQMFGIQVHPVLDAGNRSYKEFAMTHTRLIRCLPDSGPRACPGI